MKRTRLFIVILLLAVSAVRADLADDIRAVLNDKLLANAQVGMVVMDLGDSPQQSRAIYRLNATTPLIPASNLKLLTTAAALDKLGADFQFKTMLAIRGEDVALIGDGDPSLGDAEMLRKLGWDVDAVFKAWARRLQELGISQVRHVFVDDSVFDEIFLHPNWPADQQHKRYVAQVAGVNLNANCVDFYLRIGQHGQAVNYRMDPPTRYVSVKNTCLSGSKNAVWLSRESGTNNIVLRGQVNLNNDEPLSVTISDPPMFAATVLAETLSASGLVVSGQVQRDRTVRASGQWTILAIHSTPISTVLSRANKDSMNLYAEALCKRMGAAVSGTGGSWESGLAVIAAMLRSLGVSDEEFNLDDGSGLSKKNAVSPNAIARVLTHEFHSSDRELFIRSLAVGGVDGTFENRFRDSDLRGRVFGKSGYVSGVSSLSGYLRSKSGRWYAFSILMNGLPEGSNAAAKRLQERIVQAIDASSVASVPSGQRVRPVASVR